MIIGIGNDLISIKRIESTLSKFGDRFIKRVFTDIEIKKSEDRLKKSSSYAKRFAAKEAVTKALGTSNKISVARTRYPFSGAKI